MEEKKDSLIQERDYSAQILGIIRSDLKDDQIKEMLQEYHENDLANAFEELTAEERDRMLLILGSEMMSEIVSFLDDAGEYLAEIDAEDAAEIIEQMDADDAVEALEDLDEEIIFNVRKNIGMVFQNPDNQIVATVVEEDVAFGPENLGLPREEIRRRVVNALNVVNMQDYIRHAPHKLSGGQKQRIAIAGIIAMRPRVIIFDESTAMLDPLGREDVVSIMERLNREERITVINITHYMEEAARADRVIVINDGQIVMDGTAKEVFSRVDELRSRGLEVPQGTELIHELNKCGFDLPIDTIDLDECTELIFEAITNTPNKEGI